MSYYVDGGKTVENTEVLLGKMTHRQYSYFAHKFAAHAMDIARRRSYGLGEVAYYINEDAGELIEFNIANEPEARAIKHYAEDLMDQAEEIGATVDEPMYSERLENEREVAKTDQRDYQYDPDEEE